METRLPAVRASLLTTSSLLSATLAAESNGDTFQADGVDTGCTTKHSYMHPPTHVPKHHTQNDCIQMCVCVCGGEAFLGATSACLGRGQSLEAKWEYLQHSPHAGMWHMTRCMICDGYAWKPLNDEDLRIETSCIEWFLCCDLLQYLPAHQL